MKMLKLRPLLTYIGVIIWCAWTLIPIIWMVSTAFKPPKEQFMIPPNLLPVNPTLDNFFTIANPWFLRLFQNSVIVTLSVCALGLLISIFSAYAFARLRFKGRRILFYVVILSQMFPVAAILIPIYIMVANLELMDTYYALIIGNLTFSVPSAIWLLRGFVIGIPEDLEEAALIDGCTPLGAFLKIVVPLLRGGLASTGTAIFIGVWQEFLFALALIQSDNMRTLPVGILRFMGQYAFAIDWGAIMAVSTIICIPCFVLFLIIQKQLVSGLLKGSLKG